MFDQQQNCNPARKIASNKQSWNNAPLIIAQNFMRTECSFTAHAEKIAPNSDLIEIEMELTVDDFLKSGDVAEELRSNAEGVREELFKLMADVHVPQIIQTLARSHQVELLQPPPMESNSKTGIKNDPENTIDSQGVVSRNRLKISMLTDSTKSVDPVIALSVNRDNLADAIARNILHKLELRFLGEVQETERLSGLN